MEPIMVTIIGGDVEQSYDLPAVPRIGEMLQIVQPGTHEDVLVGRVEDVEWTFTIGARRPTVLVYVEND